MSNSLLIVVVDGPMQGIFFYPTYNLFVVLKSSVHVPTPVPSNYLNDYEKKLETMMVCNFNQYQLNEPLTSIH